MTATEQKTAAKKFAEYWKDKGDEKQETARFWIELLGNVLGVADPTKFIEFEKPVIVEKNQKYIDGYIPSTKVLIEQKGAHVKLGRSAVQSDGEKLTPYGQAFRYNNYLPYEEKAKWIIVSNFKEILIYNMNTPNGEPEQILLKDLPKDLYRLQFLVNTGDEHIKKEMEVSLQAGELVGKLYNAILKQYKNPDSPESLKSLNMLCVRLVFCLYAEDAGIFGRHGMFHDYLRQFPAKNVRKALIELFQVLDQKAEERDDYLDDDLAAFPYVNGGLFKDEDIEIPNFTDEIMEVLLEDASAGFNWADISPTIFGAVFESTLNPETRRSGGMHYTSIENIHKVIDPLFLDELRAEFATIKEAKQANVRKTRLEEFQKKLASLKFLDPACGSGNFLTETYISLRRLENDIIYELNQGQMMFGDGEFSPIQVSIGQFYGIEINDFAVTVAKTALWIAESQMMKATEEIVQMSLDFLPLKSYANIVEGNALRTDWESVVPKAELNYIMGNPPFVGQAMRTKEQANEMQDVFAPSKAGGKLDYVAGWFKKAADIMKGTSIQSGFVSSNSICQGESVQLLWEMLLEDGVFINFAHTTFLWTSEAKEKAAVMCVIVGFSYVEKSRKLLYTGIQYNEVNHINGYLKNAPNVFIKNRSKSINVGGAKVVQGSPPADDGRLLLSAQEKEDMLKKYPELEGVIKPFIGSREFINDTSYQRYCFWFADEPPHKYQHIPELLERFNYIREYRLQSPVDRIQKTANKPYLFTQNRQPQTEYLIIPRVSSSNRKYIPIGFLPPDVIASDSVVLVYNASLYDFGIICSDIHNAWMRTIAGRLKNDYRYAPSVYYNFPFPKPTEKQKEKICQTAQAIIDARKLYPDKSLADMYGNAMYLYPELLQAHQMNDRAVLEAYGFNSKLDTESEYVGELMKMYKDMA